MLVNPVMHNRRMRFASLAIVLMALTLSGCASITSEKVRKHAGKACILGVLAGLPAGLVVAAVCEIGVEELMPEEPAKDLNV